MEAAEQSERLSVPVVCPPAPLLQAPGPPVVTARPSDPIRRAKPGAGWPDGRMAGPWACRVGSRMASPRIVSNTARHDR